jgi:hypothetical protein
MTEPNPDDHFSTPSAPHGLAPEGITIEPQAEAVADVQALPPSPPASNVVGTPLWVTGVFAVFVFGAIGGIGWLSLSGIDASKPAPDPRVTSLEQALRQDEQHIAALEARLGSLANQPVSAAADTSALEARLTALEQRPAPVMPDIAGAVAGASADLSAKIAMLDSRLQQEASKEAAHAALASRLQSASMALDLGQKLGDIPDAPASLSRFANVAPPVESALRQSFPNFAVTAEAASRPSAKDHGFVERMLFRVENLVTIRRGDQVLVGAPATVTLEAARGKLEAGDLAGAVAALTPLDDAARAAMAPWLNDAKALLDARAALSSMAAKS